MHDHYVHTYDVCMFEDRADFRSGKSGEGCEIARSSVLEGVGVVITILQVPRHQLSQ